MNNSNNSIQIIPETFKIISKCPICDHKYTNVEAQLIEEDGESHLVYISCAKCHTSVLALIVFQTVGIISYGLITDLTANEVREYMHKEAIDCDDILNVYKGLHNNKQTFLKDLQVKHEFFNGNNR